jgi:ketosteroid isomerase-like protein
MRKIVIGGWVLSALLVAGCEKSSGGSGGSGGEAPAQSASANSAVVPSATSTSSSSAKTDPNEKEKHEKGDHEKGDHEKEAPKDHVARIKAIEEAFAAHEPKKIAALYAEESVVRTPGMPDVKGREAIEKEAEKMFAMFKDAKVTHGRVWEKDKHTFVVESVFTGTNTGDAPEMGVPKATNKPVGIMGASWYEVGEDGFIKEEHRYHDQTTGMGQLVPDKKNKVRDIITAPPDGTEKYEAKTAKEAKDAKDEKEKVELARMVKIEKEEVELENKMVGLINDHKMEDAYKLVAEDVNLVDYTQEKDLKGKKAYRELLNMYLAAFPDMKAKTLQVFGDGDFAVGEFEYTGTQKGALGPIKATNKPVDLHQIEIDQFKDGKLVKAWVWGNNLEMLTELGVIPAPGTAPAPSPSAKPSK